MALFEGLVARVGEQARVAAAATLARVEAAALEVPGVRVARDASGVRIEGRGLARRMIEDARLRFALRGWR
ncbi:MAG: hypothetical protein H0W65_08560 [Sphingomonas sp.]|uniref:hypothetical protein n=1 Tax=Sphingomonas sp. TaxID=28214 RepID=UPI0017CD58D9|nr:hypothetical protein [Sphingomonas sp.]MBA3667760.1 hypothetical protein [Sphingomonas sp.]